MDTSGESHLHLGMKMSRRFRSCDLNQPYLLPPALQDWLSVTFENWRCGAASPLRAVRRAK
jgi:hypothetical protein